MAPDRLARTSRPPLWQTTLTVARRGAHETTAVPCPGRRRGRVAACGAGAASGDAVIGFLSSQSPDPSANFVAAFRGPERNRVHRKSKRGGRIRWAEGRYDRLPALAAELVRRQVAVIVASAPPAAIAAKAATSTLPIVFSGGIDPVKLGLVAGLNRPGGNATGVSQFSAALEGKRLELLHELVPNATETGAAREPDLRGAQFDHR